jgi:GT2 family glycosyltransferase
VNGHISAASNTALMTASGEWLALLDHDDLLHPMALYRVAEVLQTRSDANLIYSDEDKMTTNGRRYAPYFKGQYNRELMWAQNVISHLGCYRRRLVIEIGGFRLGYEGSQDYDLALRVIEHSHPSQIIHIPHVLYHWRAVPGSTALASSEKNYASPASRKALQDHLSRIGIQALVGPAPAAPTMNRVEIEQLTESPLVSIIISNQERPDLLDQCIRAIQKNTDYKNIEIITLESNDVSNISAQQNLAAQKASGEYLCMMNSNIEPTSAGWLKEMLSFAQLQDIGAVGARLVSPGKSSSLRHIGLVAGLGGVVGCAHAGLEAKQVGYFGRAVLHQRVTAVTQRCLVTRKDRFLSVGGFDESLFGDFSDLDLCLKLSRAGYHSVFTPYAELLFHEEPKYPACTTPTNQHAVDLINTRWGDHIKHDRYYSPNLSLERSDFEPKSSAIFVKRSLVGSRYVRITMGLEKS